MDPTPNLPASALFSLAGQNVLITGASRSIGAASAITLAEAGTDLCLVERPTTAMKNTATRDAIAVLGRTVRVVECDLADLEDVKTVFARALDAMGWRDSRPRQLRASNGDPRPSSSPRLIGTMCVCLRISLPCSLLSFSSPLGCRNPIGFRAFVCVRICICISVCLFVICRRDVRASLSLVRPFCSACLGPQVHTCLLRNRTWFFSYSMRLVPNVHALLRFALDLTDRRIQRNLFYQRVSAWYQMPELSCVGHVYRSLTVERHSLGWLSAKADGKKDMRA
ncbi:uncharacterized protein LAESUDRAFT_555383, partial [Laetiporus sulphureus 93-53]